MAQVEHGVAGVGREAAPAVQGFDVKSLALYALAVRPSDVAAPVPEPQTVALVLALLALGATVVARRRRPA